MDYLEYAYLQAGQYESAAKLLQELNAMSALQLRDFKVGYAATAMPVRYAVERRDWAGAVALKVHEESLPQVSAITHWARAVGLARSGNPGAAEREVEQLNECLEKVRAAKDDYWIAQVEVQIAEANAWIANRKGQRAAAIQLLRSAADQEDQLEKRPVTPGAIVPAREQLGELLLELKQPHQALIEFAATLKNTPARRGAMAGAFEAAQLAGNTEKARQSKAQL
jgi:tetratricopeptide (TPR) repeat protein